MLVIDSGVRTNLHVRIDRSRVFECKTIARKRMKHARKNCFFRNPAGEWCESLSEVLTSAGHSPSVKTQGGATTTPICVNVHAKARAFYGERDPSTEQSWSGKVSVSGTCRPWSKCMCGQDRAPSTENSLCWENPENAASQGRRQNGAHILCLPSRHWSR